MGRKAFMFHEEWAQVLSSLPPEMRHCLTDALIDYFLNGIAPNFSNPAVGAIFQIFKNRMDADDKHYENKCEKSKQAIKKRWEQKKNTNEYDSIPTNTDVYDSIPTNTDVGNINLNLNTNLNSNLNLKSSNDDDVNVILASSPITKEDMLRKYRLTEEQLRHYGELFKEENKGKKYKPNDSPMKHFINWLAKRIKKDKEDYGNNRPSYEQRASEASELVEELLAKCDEVRNEGGISIDF